MNTIKYVAVLRGINVGGRRKIRMADLRKLFVEWGYDNVATYIQSGNVVFETMEMDSSAIARQISEGIEQHYGFDVPTIVRTASEMEAIIKGNPFFEGTANDFEVADIKPLHITFLQSLPTADCIASLAAFDAGGDEYAIVGKAVFIYCNNGYGKTKLNNQLLERKLKVQATTRNWKTVLRLWAMLQ